MNAFCMNYIISCGDHLGFQLRVCKIYRHDHTKFLPKNVLNNISKNSALVWHVGTLMQIKKEDVV